MQIGSEVKEYKQEIEYAQTLDDLYQVWVKYLGKKGLISQLNKELKNMNEDKRIEFGRIITQLRKILKKYTIKKKRS